MTALTVNRLRCLRELALQGSIAAAADALWLTPSAVSQQLAALQRETNVELVEKSGRGVSLTPAGRALLEHAERVLDALDDAEAALGAFQHEPMGRVHVAVLPSLIPLTLPVLEEMREEFGQLAFEVEDLETEQSLAALDCGRVDVAVVDHREWIAARRRTTGMRAAKLLDDPLVVAYHPEHPLAELPAPAWPDLARESWVIGQPPWSFMTSVFERCGSGAFEPSVVARVRDRSAALGLVRRGWGICVLPRLAVAGQSEGVAWRIVEPLLYRTTVAITRANGATAPAVKALVERLRDRSHAVADGDREGPAAIA